MEQCLAVEEQEVEEDEVVDSEEDLEENAYVPTAGIKSLISLVSLVTLKNVLNVEHL